MTVLVRPMTGVVVPVVIMRGHIVTAMAGRIGIISADPDPAAIDPFVMSGNPDRSVIGACPSMLNHDWRRRRADPNTDTDLCRGLRGADRQDSEDRTCEGNGPEGCCFHIKLDLLNTLNLQNF